MKIYHISLVVITTHEIYIFTPLNENKSRIYRIKNLNILYLIGKYIYLLLYYKLTYKY